MPARGAMAALTADILQLGRLLGALEAALPLQSGIVSQPVWAPDASAIAFLLLVNGSFDLFILPVATNPSVHATGPAQAVTHGSFLDADSRLAWSP